MTIFSAIPQGVNVRRLNPQYSQFKFTAWTDGSKHRAYGNSLREAIKKLGKDIETSIEA
jgi:hypothetical protein